MSDRDRLKWDDKYSADGYIGGVEPAAMLVEHRDRLPREGRALDIAAGEGQNAVYLAERGLGVEALDISAVGLRKAKRLAERRGVSITARLWDLERSVLPDGPFDVVVCFHYKQADLAERISEVLAPGGVLLIELPTVANLALNKHPSRKYCLEPNELLGWFPTLSVSTYVEGVFNGKAMARLVATKAA